MRFNPVTYFQNIASKNKAIAHSSDTPHFFRIRSLATLDDLLNSMSIANYPALLVHDTIDGTLTDAFKSDNYMDDAQTVFYVVQRVEYDSPEDIDTAIKNCRDIGRQILAKMLRDKAKGLSGLQFLDFASIPYQSIGPVADNVYGMMYMISVLDDAGLVYDNTKWDE